MKIRRPLCLVCIVFLFLVYLIMKDKPPSPSWDVDSFSGRMLSLSGKITDRQLKNGVLNIYLKDIHVSRNSYLSDTGKTNFPEKINGIVVKLYEYSDVEDYIRLGARIEAIGCFMPFDIPMNEGQFDSRSYYAIRGYDGMLKKAKITYVTETYSYISESLRHFRDRAFSVISGNMSEKNAGLVAAMTLGDKTGVDTEIKELYQNAGISHVLALSGLHIATLGLGLLRILKTIIYRLGLFIESYRRRHNMNANNHAISHILELATLIADIISTVILLLYCLMTGMSVSTMRAFIMFLLGLVADGLSRTYDLLSAAAFSSLIVLLINPLYIYDPPFQLSFAAVVSIGILIPVLSGLFRHIPKILEGVNLSVSVWLGTLPITASHFYQVSFAGIILNLIVVPLMSVLLLLGLGMSVMGFGVCSHFFGIVADFILNIYAIMSGTLVSIRWLTWIVGKPRLWQVIVYYGIMAIILLLNLLIDDRSSAFAVKIAGGSRVTERQYRRRLAGGKKVGPVAKRVIMGGMMILACLLLTVRKRNLLEIRNLSIGQGDCAVIRTKTDVIIIDGGSTSVDQSGKYRLIPLLKSCGIGEIDYVFISHFDSDHINAILELLDDDIYRNRVRNIIISTMAGIYDKDSENYRLLMELAKRNAINVYTMNTGDKIKSDNIDISCISPISNDPDRYSDTNDASLVLLLNEKNTGYKALFTGDISQNTERIIADELPKLNYLKVAHHGSASSSSIDFLQRISYSDLNDNTYDSSYAGLYSDSYDRIGITLGVISVGENNPYGHPNDDTLMRLSQAGIYTFRTDRSGEIMVTIDRDEAYIGCYYPDGLNRRIKLR